MVKLIINGYKGKMGKIILELAKKNPDFEVVAGIDKDTSKTSDTFPVYDDINKCDMPADVIIDFSIASAVPDVIDYAVKNKIALIECTTGLNEETTEKLAGASKSTVIFKSANMSLGINLLANILEKIAPILYDENFDIEIVEKHHNKKIDAPSGTAYLLGDVIRNSIDSNITYNFDRSKTLEKRERKEIGMSAIRGGTIVGEHEIIFAGKDEVLKFEHIAYSKELFAVGALKAAKFSKGKPPGFYNMSNLMEEIL